MFPRPQDDYDRIAALIGDAERLADADNNGAAGDKYLTGMHSDGAGKWEYTDGTVADMEFLREHCPRPPGTVKRFKHH